MVFKPTNFFYNSRTYQIKKKSFGVHLQYFPGSKIVGVFNYKWKTGGYSLSLNDSKKEYTLIQSNTVECGKLKDYILF